jgi:hypothetical protein
MEQTKELWGILCHRGGGSIFGPAVAWAKNDNGRIEFNSEKEAVEKAREWNNSVTGFNLFYEAKQIE